jgi:hypothetical protein
MKEKHHQKSEYNCHTYIRDTFILVNCIDILGIHLYIDSLA